MHGDHDLGHTVAGWAGTTIAVTGCAVTAVALAAGSATGLWLGGAVVVLAALTTWLLHLAGWGKATGPRPVTEQHSRVRDTSARRGHPGCLGCRIAGRGAAGVPGVSPAGSPAPAEPAPLGQPS